VLDDATVAKVSTPIPQSTASAMIPRLSSLDNNGTAAFLAACRAERQRVRLRSIDIQRDPLY